MEDFTPSWAGAYTAPPRQSAATDAKIAAAISGLIGGAPADRDTFGEVAGLLAAVLTQSQVDARITALTAAVGRSGAYTDLTGRPTIPSGAYADLTGKPTLFSGAYTDLTGKPTLFSGAYADLTSKPTLGTAAAKATTDFEAAGNVAALLNRTPVYAAAYSSVTGRTVLTKAGNGRVVGRFEITKTSAIVAGDVVVTVPDVPISPVPFVAGLYSGSAWVGFAMMSILANGGVQVLYTSVATGVRVSGSFDYDTQY